VPLITYFGGTFLWECVLKERVLLDIILLERVYFRKRVLHFFFFFFLEQRTCISFMYFLRTCLRELNFKNKYNFREPNLEERIFL